MKELPESISELKLENGGQVQFSVLALFRARKTGPSSPVSGLFSRPASTRFYGLLAPGPGLLESLMSPIILKL